MVKRIFFDTNPIIYYLETDSGYSDIVLNFLIKNKLLRSEFFTSSITTAEYLIKPVREQRFDLINKYDDFLNLFNFHICPITDSIALKSAQLRAKYKGLKLADALQLAVSIENQCDTFLTNDTRLIQVAEAHVLCLSDL